MRECSPADFVRRWPGRLYPIVFPIKTPPLPSECFHLLTKFGLPDELTIYCHNDVIIKVSGSATPLATIWDRDLCHGYRLGVMPSEWTRFWHLADEEYTQGGGWLCVEEVTGRLVIIDLDLEQDPILLLSSSVRTFYTILAHFVQWSENHPECTLKEITELRDDLLHQECVPIEELNSFWMNAIDTELDSDPFGFHVKLGPYCQSA